ncbi:MULTISPECIES: nucleoside deaminase [Bradyrhizobium]|jgi:tRNA(adenine34) deaminase|uniref:tRNA(Adenine34) deaminase n=1 Tax=Bradyrhizobium elkanii TaxID=29448 RepID=A0A8I1Y326_BRAEL|nr:MULTISPECIES: nucleoside deaminase [Bradyrhizobium]MBP1292573.1 tRNA(adenine34) deaminase [Bradyrhizobium elkanii]MCP1926924.1 tRNA(adenine34) deaminase [Bradyrhizobium elkanii]MCS3475551.1 tRNA(adenine34) deaminase [Bradyrhizobium elkanii]MCS3582398.1 tRNA(adenine34) deaminase [Bradyrhizobium elkanii]MCS3715965.1 tRNA(adenine34) deaminase [Bradyrhizobium elkanii]
MTSLDFTAPDIGFMQRCVSLAHSGMAKGEYPFAAVISRKGRFVCEAHNMVRCEGDVTRHAEMVALSEAQRTLKTTSLEDCTLYSTVEPCAMCAYAIRESRVGRVISGLRSPVMGGHSRWDILTDSGLSSIMPEVFATPPTIQLGCLYGEVQEAFRKRHPFAWRVIEARRIFVGGPEQGDGERSTAPAAGFDLERRLVSWVRSRILDRLWRG